MKFHSILLTGLQVLVEDLEPCAAQWKMLGTMLKIRQAKLQGIDGENKRVSNCLMGVLSEWLTTKCSPPTKEQLLKVLRTRAMGPEAVLAEEIEENEGTWMYVLAIELYLSLILHFCLGPDIPAQLTLDHLSILIGSLDGIAAKYQSFAIQLGVPHDTVKKLEDRVTRVQKYLEDMLAFWLKQKKPLSELVDAVRKPPIHNVVLANELEEKYKKLGLCKLWDYQIQEVHDTMLEACITNMYCFI